MMMMMMMIHHQLQVTMKKFVKRTLFFEKLKNFYLGGL
jgi:pheromone shutdown protein TraB